MFSPSSRRGTACLHTSLLCKEILVDGRVIVESSPREAESPPLPVIHAFRLNRPTDQGSSKQDDPWDIPTAP